MPHQPFFSLLLTSLARRSQWALALTALVALVGLMGCAGLPKDVDRPISTAFQNPGDTALGQWVQARRTAQQALHPSGFMLLSGPQAAYSSRLALVEAAQKTLDLQYYAIHADASSERLLLSVADAARRGVRVRLLLDDFHSTGRDALVMRLAFVPNVEMRMFNPLSGARGSPAGRVFSLLSDFSRTQQRMHNKLFIADNAVGITGGRNLGNAYFGNSDSGNFVDLDVLAAGGIVQDLSRSFDSYWNNERAYPVQSLITREELERLRDSIRAAEATQQQRVESAGATGVAPETPPTPSGRSATDTRRAHIWNQEPMDLRQAPLVWAPAAVLVDRPAKIPPDGTSTATLPDQNPHGATPATIAALARPRASATAAATATAMEASADTLIANQPVALPRALPAESTSATLGDGNAPPLGPPSPRGETSEAQSDTVVDGLLQLIGLARRDLLIISPYFVPGPDMNRAFASARARGVRVRVLTNSLASNDAPIAHAGYARHRPTLLAMGVELYEMRSELTSVLRGALGATGSMGATGASGSSRAMLHTKLLIVDGRLLVIGSMNLDIRSQRQNTEVALLIRSAELSRRATVPIETALQDAAWQVQQTDRGLVWRAPQGSGLPHATTEPDASLPLRLLLQLLGPLAPDHLL
ncbi:MAG: phospholipase D family protein [Acidovorax sp.]|uniref:phospholipase D family protein n=1 Tax=Acidovorax sp. TaxID=1872122 RepID=UPI0026139859|nr:phospholipase D family protein [Acidovorax sp.]MDH4418852.1 phospholipase D family protein [Acidovorax sp.]